MSSDERRRLQASLDRIDVLSSAVDRLTDAAGRAAARELLELVLDLHGLALARVVALVAAAEGGTELVEQMAADQQVRAVLLLHGLHPEPLEERVERAIERAQPELGGTGCRVSLIEVRAAVARLRIAGADHLAAIGASQLRQQIEAALIDAAPDLDGIVIEGLDAGAEQAALAAG